MGDSILASLSLPPSGRAASAGAKTSAAGTPDGTQTPFLTPVIGIISNEDVPVMVSAKRTLGGEGATKVDLGKAEQEAVAKPRGGRKRKQPDRSDSEEEEVGAAPGEADAAREERANGAEDSERLDRRGRSLPGETSLRSVFASRLNSRAPVVRDGIPAGVGESGGGGEIPKSPRAKCRNQTRQRPPDEPDSASHVSDNKE